MEKVRAGRHVNEINLSQSTIYDGYEQQPSTSEQGTLKQLEPLDLDVF